MKKAEPAPMVKKAEPPKPAPKPLTVKKAEPPKKLTREEKIAAKRSETKAKRVAAEKAAKAKVKESEKQRKLAVKRGEIDPRGHKRSPRYKGGFAFFMTQLLEFGALAGVLVAFTVFAKQTEEALQGLGKKAVQALEQVEKAAKDQ